MDSKSWADVTNNKLSVDDIDIHPDHLNKFNKPYEDWILREEDCENYYEMYPLEFTEDGIRFKCVYTNVNKNSPNFRKLYRLTVWVNGSEQIDFNEEEYEPLIKKWKV